MVFILVLIDEDKLISLVFIDLPFDGKSFLYIKYKKRFVKYKININLIVINLLKNIEFNIEYKNNGLAKNVKIKQVLAYSLLIIFCCFNLEIIYVPEGVPLKSDIIKM